MIQWHKHDKELIIEQTQYRRFVYNIIGIFGILLFPIGLLGIVIPIAEGRIIFDTNLLIFQFIFTLGIAMMYAGFSSQSGRKYSEKTIFSNADREVHFYAYLDKNISFSLPYDSISHLYTVKDRGGPDNPDIYYIYIISIDGGEYWLTEFNSKTNDFIMLQNEIKNHTGFEIMDASSFNTKKNVYARNKPRSIEQPLSVSHSHTEAGDKLYIKSIKKSFIGYITALIVYGMFLMVPFYITNQFIRSDLHDIIKVFTGLFIVMWYMILIGIFIISLRTYNITVNNIGINLELILKPLFFIKSTIFIPLGSIKGVRTNRPARTIFSLSLVIDNEFNNLPLLMRFTTKFSTYRKGKISSKISGGQQSLSLWESPDITVIQYMEQVIKNRFYKNP